ncbi:DUF1295 domain-containing protein [Candidatus Protochlamydia phocaeensis]|uniref:DUF1295 domain-containing protein n=1 Tax=Candidatus Protochlamydia phocaeensis TaxID=1414722 RepID=UPI000837C37A|nr:DUF1295 domain-containing protein [Candidatus Protochlamydia phocaeensis]
MLDFLLPMGISLLVIEAFMLLLWMIYLIQKNISLAGIGWGLSFILAALISFILGEGYVWRRLLVLTVVSIWALRLVLHLISRFHQGLEDPRYQKVLHSPLLPGPITLKALTLYLLQGLFAAVLSLPFALMSQNVLPFFGTCEVFGLLIWMAGVSGEAVADRQLERFKQTPGNGEIVCKQGLWKYARHPDYFFEWVIWIGYFVMALSSPLGWLSVIAPILMLYLMLYASRACP